MKHLLSFLIPVFALFALRANAQDASPKPVKWQFSAEKKSDQEYVLHLKGAVEKGWQLFSTTMGNDDPNTRVVLDSSVKATITGITENGKLENRKEPLFDNLEIKYFENEVELVAAVKATGPVSKLSGTITYMVLKGEDAVPEETTFEVPTGEPAAAKAGADTTTAGAAVKGGVADDDASNKSLWWIFIASFGGGFIALITPCVFSMIPITVSFFTKRSQTRAQGIRNAFTYSLSIIVIYTLLGFLITKIFGASALNSLASNGIANMIFFVIFLLFGFSFLGAFEISLPSSWANVSDSKAGMSSMVGIFFMALTLAIVSFSCTGPILGNLLVLAAKGGNSGPLVGMFGFSLALAIPFSLFALFPSLLNKIGKSGGWLNAVKVTLGFLELALALKFLSNVDMAYHWNLLDREIFLALWIAIFALLTLYLVGKLKLSHDSDVPFLTVTRLCFAIAAFTFTVYMVPGMWGAPLKGISGFLPHEGSQDFNLNKSLVNIQAALESGEGGGTGGGNNANTVKPKKLVDVLHSEIPGVEHVFFDYEEALAAAKVANKPLMIDFTGHTCVNCRKFEKSVLSNPAVMKILRNDFIVASLYTDEKTKLSDEERYESKTSGLNVKDVGLKNQDIQITKFNRNSQPYYIPVDLEGNALLNIGYGYDPKENVDAFVKYLEDAKAEFAKRHAK
ncbi:protein-disulfide reductase DsbD family protein [Chitinophaga ginsengisegetis]|uniref:protein-disulfide reductase DsbD family protein n=1 Tax=Chitinophaga ginsengisegetis TaxID=393003 RepID=UPI000DBA6957|nr:thioredoxin family protein [Chitinophaga ginsengisegetis]MDR6565376.1 thiol:disulfide interchange protein DsbD [Chitinophaga ginsengisegetis]MDR6645104.1 thiol:disulfide interchange protein DsbD [Chitinophaga ginsengisegetis]MDR6652304.1 thiol:disulfide interchange protein DsbD [Chitinophaga ginsengisegetis]